MPSSPLTAAEISTLRESGELVVQYVFPLSVGSACWGIYLVMAYKALRTLYAKGLQKSIPRAVLFTLIGTMFLLSTATLFRAYADFFVLVSNILLATDIPSLEDRFRAGDIYRYRFYFAYLVIFQVEVLLGDSIVIWRTWALWKDRPGVVLLPVVLWLTSLVLFIVWAATSSTFTFIYTGSQAVSMAANGLSTVLIAYRAWSHRHILKLGGYSRSTFMQKILALLVESGCIYLLMVLFDVVSHALTLSSYTPWSISINCFDHIVAQGLGLYPTLLIIMVEKRKTMWDRSESDDLPRAVTSLRFNVTSSASPEDSHALESRPSRRTDDIKSVREVV